MKKEIRKALGIKPGSLIRISQQGKEARIKPASKGEILAQVENIAKQIIYI